VPQGGAEGVIVGEGGRFYGWALYLVKGKPVFTYNLLNLKRTRFEAAEALAPGKHTIEYDFRYDGLGEATLAYNNMSGVGRGGTGTLKVDGKVVSTQKLERTLPLVKPLDQTFNIGSAGAYPVDDREYKVPFKFTGNINKLTIALDPPKLTPDDVKKLEAANRAAQDAQ
jgi:arylsulfatase